MADEQSEEFRKFILDNREIIEKILNEGKEAEEPDPSDAPTESVIDEDLEKAKAKAIELNDAVLKIIGDEEVQKHFITGCLEFFHFFEAVLHAAPLSPEAKEAVDKLENTLDTTVRNVVVAGAKDKMENISINDVKKKGSEAHTSTKEKLENITIRDIKENLKERMMS
jgi:hypothetical protein